MNKRSIGRISVGHPVDVASGTMFDAWEDIRLPGRFELIFRRHYSTASIENAAGVLGPGWLHDFEIYLEEEEDSFLFRGPGGAESTFQKSHPILADGTRIRSLSTFHELEVRRPNIVVSHWDPDDYQVKQFVFEYLDDRKRFRISSICDVTGQGIDFAYDEFGRVFQVKQRRERRSFVFKYNCLNRLFAVSHSSEKGSEQQFISFEYDENERLSCAKDALGISQRFEYDPNGRIIREITRSGNIFQFRYDVDGRCNHATGLENFDLKKFRFYPSIGHTEVTDSHGEIWRYDYRRSGQVTREHTPLGAMSLTEYDEFDRIVAIVDPVGGKTSYAYDDQGNRNQITDPLGRITKFKYNSWRQIIEFVDTQGGSWKFVYDQNARLVRTEDPVGHRWLAETNMEGEVVIAEDSAGNRRRFEYDLYGQLILCTDWSGNATHYRYNESGWISAIVDPRGNTTKYTYDRLFRVTQIEYGNGAKKRFEFDPAGNITTIAENNDVTRIRYGTCSRILQVTDALGAHTKYLWDSEPEKLRSIINAKNESHLFEYDADGRLIAEIDFGGRLIEYSYDLASNLISQSNGAGQVTWFEVDALNRVVSKNLFDGSIVKYEYDALGNLAMAENSDCVVQFERDACGRITKDTQGEFFVSSEYDSLGNRTARSTSLNHETEFEYDANGYLTSIHTPISGHIKFQRDAMGNEIQRQLPIGTNLFQRFDKTGRLESQSLERVQFIRQKSVFNFIDDADALFRRIYSYDKIGNLVGIEDSQRHSRSYAYDYSGQLNASVSLHGANEKFAFDVAGNISAIGSQSNTAFATTTSEMEFREFQYGAGSRLDNDARFSFEYDTEGRLVKRIESRNELSPDVWEFNWNGEGWLSSVKTPIGEYWYYTYDPFGRRISKHGPSKHIIYVWDGDVIVHEIESSGLHSTWVFEQNRSAAVVYEKGKESKYCINDHLGSPINWLNQEGKIVWSENRTAWGERDSSDFNSFGPGLGFPGQWLDDESGLYYNRFRYYDPSCGRYISPDPIGLRGGLNAYAYVPAPTHWIDPFGLQGTTTTNVGGRDYQFTQDSQGRTVRAEGPICNPNRIQNEHRDTNAQKSVSSGTGDHAGHLIGNQFGGPGGKENLVRMCPTLNLGNWKRMENQLVALSRNNSVQVVVTVHYKGNSTKPSRFTVDAVITDRNGKTTRQRFTHKNC